MASPPLDDRALRAVAQHAETARVFGCDDVPVRVGAPKPTGTAPPNDLPVPGAIGAPAVASRDRTAAAARLDELRARYERDAPHRAFVTHFDKIVFGEGEPCPRLVFVGEAPGAEEDRTGRPFVGRAGKLLDDMIRAMGLTREAVYICNVLKTRPPDNATPTSEEIRLCAPYLYEQLTILSPEVIITLGLPATKALLGTAEPMGRLRGRWWSFTDFAGREVPVMPTYHPAYLLRNYTKEERLKVWSDLRLAMSRLGLKPS